MDKWCDKLVCLLDGYNCNERILTFVQLNITIVVVVVVIIIIFIFIISCQVVQLE